MQTRDVNPPNGLSLIFDESVQARDVNPQNGQSLLFDERAETRDVNPPNGLSLLFDERAQNRYVSIVSYLDPFAQVIAISEVSTKFHWLSQLPSHDSLTTQIAV